MDPLYGSPAYQRAAAQREADQQARERAEEQARQERQRQNAAARATYDAQLAAAREQRQAADDARLDGELGKDAHRAQWLVDHPGESTATFESKVWPTLRPVLLERHREARIEQKTAALRRTGAYGRF
jgi:hypothetical protein